MLTAGVVKTAIVAFLNSSNSSTQESKDAAIENFAQELENIIYNAIKNAQLTIPPGLVAVSGSPTTQTNAAPIVVQNGLS